MAVTRSGASSASICRGTNTRPATESVRMASGIASPMRRRISFARSAMKRPGGFKPKAMCGCVAWSITGIEEWYQLANTRQLPYLPYNAISDTSGQPLTPPNRTPVDTPVTAIAQAIQLFRETLQSTTAVHDPSLGRVDPRLKSGRAIQFLQRQSQQATSNFLSNHERSLHREGTIINNLLYPV